METETLPQALDSVDHGLAVLEGDGRLLFSNQAARSAFAERAHWSLQDGELGCRDPEVRERWLRALRTARDKGVRSMIELPSRDSSVHAVLAPVSGAPGRVLLILGRSEVCGALELQLFAARHGLTGAETQVLQRLSKGLTPAQIAQAHRVAPSTVSSQILAIRGKTGAASIRALIEAVAKLPPLRPVVEAVAAH